MCTSPRFNASTCVSSLSVRAPAAVHSGPAPGSPELAAQPASARDAPRMTNHRLELSRSLHLLVTLTLSGCGTFVQIADLASAPRRDGPVQVQVPAGAATEELMRAPSEGVERDSVI